MKWELNQSEVKIPALILISKEVHCLNNIFKEKYELRYKRGDIQSQYS